MRIYLMLNNMENNNLKKIVITGGAGFVGSHLIEQLAKNPQYQIYSIDDYSSGSIRNHVQNVKYLTGQTKDIEKLLDFIPSMIYHLGEYSRTSASFVNPNYVWEHNCYGTFKVVEFCRKNKVRLLYAGSSTKMADGGQGRNQSPYSWTKATNIDLIKRYGEWFGLDYVIVYFYNVYGGREVKQGEYATLIASWKQKMKKKQKLQIVSPGTQIRSFTYIDDIVKGIIAAGQKGNGDGYPLGSQQFYTLWEVGQMFGFKKKQDFQIVPQRPGDRKTSVIDLEKTHSQLGWKAEIKLKDHIQNFLKSLIQQ